ncbi:MAG: hypothetical protein HY542_06935 [Deltaproteobacteria bacterium]|nr:hypothetical protein [Deltaproteobacteria bacterium]
MIIKRSFLAVGVVVFLLAGVLSWAASPLDKTEWRVEITPEGAAIPHHVDRILFKDGVFTSVIFERRGFPTTPYTASKKGGGSVTWKSKQKHISDGTLVWEAEISGDALNGTMVWEKPDGTVVKHALVGGPPLEETAEAGAAAPATTPGASTTSTVKRSAAKKGFFGCSLLR